MASALGGVWVALRASPCSIRPPPPAFASTASQHPQLTAEAADVIEQRPRAGGAIGRRGSGREAGVEKGALLAEPVPPARHAAAHAGGGGGGGEL
eukprot:CAMPEP_0185323040 /NCGR_PEP_ID=MMETSP1363-20130426/60911_1 /TAXON_ID=38817 /ORGANISM="Gephyrocapsa oceanica, Strain RCC1303" /LENGTH=94 /DNA_ID=CAMNT_0027921609 /DNA_START=78 /DNA_END=360 /DNA_ORIENTATION=+